MNISIVEKYRINKNAGFNRLYVNFNDLAETVYVLNVDGKDINYPIYDTIEEARAAMYLYDKRNRLKEVSERREITYNYMISYRRCLPMINRLHRYFKSRGIEKGKKEDEKYFLDCVKNTVKGFQEDNPVIKMLPELWQWECYKQLMKRELQKSNNEYYKFKKDYLILNKTYKQLKNECKDDKK